MHNDNVITKEIGKIDGLHKYDILVPISGGKDGIYLLWYLKKNTDYRILAFNYNNWFISNKTNENIIHSLKKIGCDYISFQPQWNLSKEIYKTVITKMGEICIACEMILNFSVFQYAVKNRIPYVAWGLTKEQMKKKNISNFKVQTSEQYYRNLEKYYNMLIEKLFEDDTSLCEKVKNEYTRGFFSPDSIYPCFVYPFYFLPYNPCDIEKVITNEVDWVRPYDTGGISSNCVINNLHVFIKKHVYGIDYYQNTLREKLKNGQISSSVYQNAITNLDDKTEYNKIINDLDINLTLEEIIDGVRTFPKNALLRSEKYIGI